MTNKPHTISPYLGKGERGARRKAALKKLAGDAGHRFDGRPSIGRWLCALADKAGTKPEAVTLSDEQLHAVVDAPPQELDDLEAAIHIARLRTMVKRLAANGIECITGESEGWAWMNYVIVRGPVSQAVYADLAELRILLDTVREMDSPRAAFERWLPKVKEVRDEKVS